MLRKVHRSTKRNEKGGANRTKQVPNEGDPLLGGSKFKTRKAQSIKESRLSLPKDYYGGQEEWRPSAARDT